MSRITKVEIRLMDNGHWQVAVTKEFAPEYGGGETTFLEAAGTSVHSALDVARGMVTVSPLYNPDANPLNPDPARHNSLNLS